MIHPTNMLKGMGSIIVHNEKCFLLLRFEMHIEAIIQLSNICDVIPFGLQTTTHNMLAPTFQSILGV